MSVGGFCPVFRSDNAYLFVPVFGSLKNGKWLKAVDANASFPPQGTIFVPPELVPAEFEHGHAAAWEVEDQPDYVERGHSARFRAMKLVDPPIEVCSIQIPSDAAGVRKSLSEDGLRIVPHRKDRAVLVKFADGVAIRVRLSPHSVDGQRSVVDAAQFMQPIPAWKPERSLPTMTFQFSGQTRTFLSAHELGSAPDVLDLATLDEAISSMLKPGGLGAMPTVSISDARKSIQRLEDLLAKFRSRDWPARSARLAQFLDQAREASAERETWEAFLLNHSLVKQVVETEVARVTASMKDEARKEILAEETALRQRIRDAEVELGQWEELVSTSKGEIQALGTQKEELQRELVAIALSSASTSANATEPPKIQEASPQTTGVLGNLGALPDSSNVQTLSTSGAAIKHLERNLITGGVLKVSAQQLAREVFVAASVGQIIFLKGSFAETVAQCIVCSAGGGQTVQYSVRVGATQELNQPADTSRVVLINGANRACISSYGDWIRRLMQDRALRKHAFPAPMIIATVLEGPGTLPLVPELAIYGPVFDTSCLAWSPGGWTENPSLGRWEPTAWDLKEEAEIRDEWDSAIESLFPASNVLWDRMSKTALKRLQCVGDEKQPTKSDASFLFGWVFPYLVACGGDATSQADFIRSALVVDACSDQRLNRLLDSLGWREA